jgi:hypothetical protein
MMSLGAIQLGVMAACVVLFVPMGMAGWHLSRNKMLFFSGVLFITLAVGVHLTPYFPSISDFASSVSSFVVFNDPNNNHRHNCLTHLHDVVWESNNNNNNNSWGWSSSSSSSCDFHPLTRSDTSDLLNGSWVVIAGDSQARFIALALLQLVLDANKIPSLKSDLFKRHSDYQIVVDSIGFKLDFIWAPYISNLTHLILNLQRNRNYPDVLVMGSGLWHMLHFTNASDFALHLHSLTNSVVSLLPISSELEVKSPPPPHLFWIGMPTLINSMLNTEEKREKMTDTMRVAYDEALRRSKVLRQSGGPLLLLDMESLTWNCGVKCTEDGMHYQGAVYEAAIHILLNALLIQSHQTL